jgi:hypothetical protein
MTHPEDLLAEYVDGTLSDHERAVVDAHLASCTTCREEVELAGGVVTMLSTLPEEPVPLGLTAPVVAEARRASDHRRQPASDRWQWAFGLAAAACLVLLAVVVLPNVVGGSANDQGGGGGSTDRAALGAESTLGGAGAAAVETSEQDYDEQGVGDLAKQEGNDVAAGLPSTVEAPVPQDTLAKTDAAVACLTTAGATMDETHTLIRLIDARYLGTPAYLAVFAQGPGADQPADRVTVWVVAKRDCSILLLASQRT